MAIRIRWVGSFFVALCAAKTDPEPNDIYLDDNAHMALATKFALDWKDEMDNPPIDDRLARATEHTERRDNKTT